ncbi:hypothetical protein [Streptomyces sp. OK228]|uniref:hypothetical protein n=1 Tax=Streptomyces sp. OK228 TaxID=1882786 RepID=UPI000BC572A9|nr:hypothetical protein [Streptomyces sp. OK228]SOE25655.1 hypothetical protein SAMN05442782_2398 [Streptomyces sp. OK228]
MNEDDIEAASWEGGHALVVELGDCDLWGHCQCGKSFGNITPDKSLDDFAMPWERHVMTEVPDS